MAVKKNQLAQKLAEKMAVSKKQAGEWIDAFTDEITKVLRTGEKVNITGFGIFKVSDRKAREGINPRTGEKIHMVDGNRENIKITNPEDLFIAQTLLAFIS